MGSTGDTRGDSGAGTLVGPAWSLRWRAPELAVLLGERASTWAARQGDELGKIRAETAVVLASCRLGQRLAVIDRAIEATRAAERHADADAAAALRIELAGCAAAAGVPAIGGVVLRPLLSSAGTAPAVRAAALVRLVECLAHLGRHPELDSALAEADEFYGADPELDLAERVVRRAVLRAVAAGAYRRRGNARAALDAARDGADLLDGLTGPPVDGGAARARVTEQVVSSLLDLGRTDEALATTYELLDKPVRAPAAAATGWLALAAAVRARVPADEHEAAVVLLGEAAALAQRHRLDDLHAESLSALAEAHERAGDVGDAVACLRDAQVIRLRQVWARHSARTALLAAFGEARHPDEFVRLLAASPRRAALATSALEQSSDPLAGNGRRGTDDLGERPALPRPEPVLPVPQLEVPVPDVPVPDVPDVPVPAAAASAVSGSSDDFPFSAFSAFAAWSPGSERAPEVVAPVRSEPPADAGGATSPGPRHAADVAGNARAMLASLGVTVSGGGRRRRARDDADDGPADPALPPSDRDRSVDHLRDSGEYFSPSRTVEPPVGTSPAQPDHQPPALAQPRLTSAARPAPIAPPPSVPPPPPPPATTAPPARRGIAATLGGARPPDGPGGTAGNHPARSGNGLGDLLTDALLAYQDVRAESHVPEMAARPDEDAARQAESAERDGRVTPLSARRAEPAATSPSARHRSDDHPVDTQWMSPRWGSPAS